MEDAKFDEQPSVLQKLQKWGDCAAYGEPVFPTRFVPMKTPLSSEIIENWDCEDPPAHPLTLGMLVDAQTRQGRHLGMIIDLSNHLTLYAADLKAHQIRYERVPLVAKILPAQQAMNRVIEIAEQFWSSNPDQYIGIHCAYGFNRTGFAVCSYLVQACHMSVQEALDSFAVARPPGVRHEQFVEELHKRYDGLKTLSSFPHAESFSDLRGYNRQTIESLNSEFGAVAAHLTGQDATIAAERSGGSGISSMRASMDVSGNSPPFAASQQIRSAPMPALSKSHLHSMSGKSIDAPLSHCESVNNESLDLDERDIFKHFASRPNPSANIPVPGHHRYRKDRLGNLRAPSIESVGEASESSRSPSVSPAKASRSPFSTVQDSDEIFRISTAVQEAEMPADSNQSANTALDLSKRETLAQPSVSSMVRGTERIEKAVRPPLYPSPVSARITSSGVGKSRLSQCLSRSDLDSSEQESVCVRERQKPCTIM